MGYVNDIVAVIVRMRSSNNMKLYLQRTFRVKREISKCDTHTVKRIKDKISFFFK